jgi:hypothetical protein
MGQAQLSMNRASISDDTLRYVLSAGRTGTVFLERLINEQLDGVVACHEPAATRYQMILANVRNDLGLGSGLLKRIFESSRRRRVERAGGIYVEINPFLSPMTDLLSGSGSGCGLRIVHMVRDPASWAVSISTFKASTRFRRLIDYVPFAKPYPAPRPKGWGALGEYERALWRWRWCNERISSLHSTATAYSLVRYEDLFSGKAELETEALGKIAQTLGLPGDLVATDDAMSARANPSKGSGPDIDLSATRRICGDLARTYGYAY